MTNRTAPTFGAAVGYFTVLYLVLNGEVPEKYNAEAVAMAGVLFTHIFMEMQNILSWVGRIIHWKLGIPTKSVVVTPTKTEDDKKDV